MKEILTAILIGIVPVLLWPLSAPAHPGHFHPPEETAEQESARNLEWLKKLSSLSSWDDVHLIWNFPQEGPRAIEGKELTLSGEVQKHSTNSITIKKGESTVEIKNVGSIRIPGSGITTVKVKGTVQKATPLTKTLSVRAKRAWVVQWLPSTQTTE